MKSKSSQLLDKSIAAMIAAIEIYNKPDFLYRGEAFSILAINGWELLLKAKYLRDNKNKMRSLYVMETIHNKNGSKSKRRRIKATRSGNPFTHSIDFVAERLISGGKLERAVWDNISALIELRDSAIHFYNYSSMFNVRIQEIGTASIKNYVILYKKWFGRDLSAYNFYLMPLAFAPPPKAADIVLLNSEEKKFCSFLDKLESRNTNEQNEFSIALNTEVRFTKTVSKDNINVSLTGPGNAIKVTLTEEQIRERYPMDYSELIDKCKKRYSNFIVNQYFHNCRKKIVSDKKYAYTRLLDPEKPQSGKKQFYSQSIFSYLDQFYKRRK